MGIVNAADFVVADIFVAQLFGQPVHHLIGFLRDGFLHLNLQDEVGAALQVEAKPDLLAEVVLDLGHGGGESREPDQSINADKNHR